MSLTAIVCVDKNWAIGKGGALLFRIRRDLQNFRRITEGGIVLVGRKTLATFPNGAPLKNRLNVVLSRSECGFGENVLRADCREKAFEILRENPQKSAFLIGGESVYKEFLPFCARAVVTKVDFAAERPDAFFPNLDEILSWRQTQSSGKIFDDGLSFEFCEYENCAAQSF